MKKLLVAIAIATGGTLPVFAAFDPDCVLYYDFETLAEDGYTVENMANPGVMRLGGLKKGFATVVEDTPSEKIRQTRTTVPAGDSSHALKNVLDDATWDARYCEPPDGTDYFATTNFTIELFYKMIEDRLSVLELLELEGVVVVEKSEALRVINVCHLVELLDKGVKTFE